MATNRLAILLPKITMRYEGAGWLRRQWPSVLAYRFRHCRHDMTERDVLEQQFVHMLDALEVDESHLCIRQDGVTMSVRRRQDREPSETAETRQWRTLVRIEWVGWWGARAIIPGWDVRNRVPLVVGQHIPLAIHERLLHEALPSRWYAYMNLGADDWTDVEVSAWAVGQNDEYRDILVYTKQEGET